MAFQIGVGVIGGLGLFLFGMQMMGNGLQKAAGKRLERIIEILTSNKFIGVLVGIFVTGIIQSSSATTVMVVGFVNAGVMKLTQAVGVIMGANVGTTITGQLISFKLEHYAPLAVGIGMIFYMTSKKDNVKQIAEIFIGLGILFIGMEFLKDALKPLRGIQAFNDLMVSFGDHPSLGVLIGFLLTLTVQSSSASIGMLIALASQGALPLAAAMPILYGDNIGTCTTALISSIGASRNAKRAAIIHLIFNLIGTLLFVFVFTKPIMGLVQSWNPGDVARQIANTHTIFNISNVLIQLPFSFLLIKIVMWLVPEKEDEKLKSKEKSTKYIDKRLLGTPSIALSNSIRETLHMGNIVKKSYKMSLDSFFELDKSKVMETFKVEKEINKLEKEITDFLVELSNCDISDYDRKIIDGLFNSVNDIERIGDHADNIAELSLAAIENKLLFSKKGKEELNVMYEMAMKGFEYALESIKTGKTDKVVKVIELEEKVDQLEKKARQGHINRLNHNECSSESGIIFLDIISNIERISDLSANIAKFVLEISTNS